MDVQMTPKMTSDDNSPGVVMIRPSGQGVYMPMHFIGPKDLVLRASSTFYNGRTICRCRCGTVS